jgi:hypothetical protein
MADKPFLDELMHFTVHEHEFKQLPVKIQKAFKEHEDLVCDWLLVKNRPAMFKKLLKDYLKQIKKHKGEESNAECMTLGFMIYLLDHMNAQEVRKLNLEKLLTK